jgi:hypothetical protein
VKDSVLSEITNSHKKLEKYLVIDMIEDVTMKTNNGKKKTCQALMKPSDLVTNAYASIKENATQNAQNTNIFEIFGNAANLEVLDQQPFTFEYDIVYDENNSAYRVKYSSDDATTIYNWLSSVDNIVKHVDTDKEEE